MTVMTVRAATAMTVMTVTAATGMTVMNVTAAPAMTLEMHRFRCPVRGIKRPVRCLFKALEGCACELALLSFISTAVREDFEGR